MLFGKGDPVTLLEDLLFNTHVGFWEVQTEATIGGGRAEKSISFVGLVLQKQVQALTVAMDGGEVQEK